MNDDLGKPLELQKNDILKVSYRDVKDAKEIKKIIEEEESKLPPEKRKKVAGIEKRNKWSIVWRSAVLPGWGQWKAGKKGYASLTFFSMLGAAAYVNSQRRAALAEEKTYNLLTTPLGIDTLLTLATQNETDPNKKWNSKFSPGQTGSGALVTPIILGQVFYSPYGNAVNKYNNSLQIIEVIFAAQLIHAFFIGRAWEKEDPNTTIGKKAAFGEWNFNASPRQAYAPTAAGVSRETFYEVNYEFRF
jgi:hypothetical protein